MTLNGTIHCTLVVGDTVVVSSSCTLVYKAQVRKRLACRDVAREQPDENTRSAAHDASFSSLVETMCSGGADRPQRRRPACGGCQSCGCQSFSNKSGVARLTSLQPVRIIATLSSSRRISSMSRTPGSPAAPNA